MTGRRHPITGVIRLPDRSGETNDVFPWNERFWLAVSAAYVVVVFTIGGSARPEVAGLPLLRGLAVLGIGLAVAGLPRLSLIGFWPLLLMGLGILALPLVHLVPLPPGMFASLPGRTILADIDRVIGLDGLWRPISMTPMHTANAFMAVIVQRQIALSAPYPYTDREPVTTPERLRYRLKGEPLQAAALRKLAMYDGNSIALLLLSQQVSRRDPVAQALLLDQAALSGRLGTTLRHYDILMAITPQTRSALVQTLASAAWQPGIVPALKPYADRPWMDDFLVQAARTADPGTQFATLIEANPFLLATLRKGENPTGIIRIMAARGDFDTAFRVADLSARGDRSWRQMDLTKASTDPGLAPLTWQTDGAISKSAIEVNGALFLNAVMPPGIKSPILRRYTRLAPGMHVLTTRLLYLTSTRPQLQWSIQCASLPIGPFAINRLASPS